MLVLFSAYSYWFHTFRNDSILLRFFVVSLSFFFWLKRVQYKNVKIHKSKTKQQLASNHMEFEQCSSKYWLNYLIESFNSNATSLIACFSQLIFFWTNDGVPESWVNSKRFEKKNVVKMSFFDHDPVCCCDCNDLKLLKFLKWPASTNSTPKFIIWSLLRYAYLHANEYDDNSMKITE